MVLNELKKGSFEIDGFNQDLYGLKIITRPDDFISFFEYQDRELPFSNNPSEATDGSLKLVDFSIKVINQARNEEDKENNRQMLSEQIIKGYHDFRFSFRPFVIYRGRLNSPPKIERIKAAGLSYEVYTIDLKMQPLKRKANPLILPITTDVPINLICKPPFDMVQEPIITFKNFYGTEFTIVVDDLTYTFTSEFMKTGNDFIVDCQNKVVYSTDRKDRLEFNCPIGYPRLSEGSHTIVITATADEILFNEGVIIL